jgi:hypothetical protein
MKSLTVLWNTLAEELASWCSTSATRDIETVARRVETEGISFLTISLANFGNDFQKSLAQGHVDSNSFAGFHKRAGLPAFLSGFLSQVFTLDGSRLLDEPNVDAVFAIRQLTLMMAKIKLDCTERRVKAAFDAFIECEKELKELVVSEDDLARFAKSSSVLFAGIFSEADSDVYHERILPRHGPGKTAERLTSNSKFELAFWTTRLESVFPYRDHAIPSWREESYLLDRVQFLEPKDEIPVRVVSVPKTLKTPRIIAIEPAPMQFMQQGLLRCLMQHFHKDDLLRSVIGFRDQQPNQAMARKGSLDGSLATLDLSEASDRVSNQLVRVLFHRFPSLSEAVDATRSRKADVPGHGVIRLAKFASMGSALCFPIEAFVFTTIIFDAIAWELKQPLTRGLVNRYRGLVRVYGDDIIVPVEFAACVRKRLETFGFRVNIRKSFMEGNFRESCGGDYFMGEDVTPIRLRNLIPAHTQHASEMVSLVAFRNLLFKRGLWQTAMYLDDLIQGIVKHYPVVEETSPVLGRLSSLGWQAEAADPDTHAPVVRGYVVRSESPSDPLDGEGALLKFFLSRSSPYEVDYFDERGFQQEPLSEGHLERAGRPEALYLKLRWRTPF